MIHDRFGQQCPAIEVWSAAIASNQPKEEEGIRHRPDSAALVVAGTKRSVHVITAE
jgi:hypothetical protein